jgi:hypothetical protein
MFHVRRRPADSQPRRRKKKPLGVSTGGGSGSFSGEREGPMLVEITHTGEAGRRIKLHGNEPIEVSIRPVEVKKKLDYLFSSSLFRLDQQTQTPFSYSVHQFRRDTV